MSQPGSFGSIVPDKDWMVRKIQELEKKINELAAADVFAPMGIHPLAGGMQFDGSVVINGDLAVPNGSITNAALQNPIAGDIANGSITNFALTGGISGLSTMMTKTVTVPSGFTKAFVIANSDMTATNTTATDDHAFLRVKIDGVGASFTSGTYTKAGNFSFVGSNYSRVLTGLGSSFDVIVEAGADLAGWAADPTNNVLNLNSLIVFTR